MGVKKISMKKAKSKLKSVGAKLKGVVGGISSRAGGGGRGRSHGPSWYANKILKERMKKKLFKLKYGGR